MKILLADIGSTYTKLCLVEAQTESVLGWAHAPTTIATDINEGLDAAQKSLGGLMDGNEPIVACSSAAGPRYLSPFHQ